MLRRILVLAVAALLATTPSYAAGTVTVSETTLGSIKLVKFTWTSSAGGAADGATTLTYDGGIQRIVTVPDGGGTQPTDLYDITLLDGNSVDVLVANGANRSNTTTEQVPGSALGITVASALTLHVTNAGASKGGVVYVYIATGATNAGIPLPSPVTAYAVLTGGTTSTAPLQQVSGLGTAAQVLTSNGAGTLPTWQATSAAGHVILGATHTDSLAGTVVLGDIIHGNATPKWARLAGNTTATKQFLTQTGTGAVSAAPTWEQPASTDLSDTASIALLAATQTLTNKAITPRITTEADATSVSPNADTTDVSVQVNTQATGTLTVNNPSGTPVQGQRWVFRIKSTNVQTYSWGAAFRGGVTLALPTVSTAAKTDYLQFLYNSTDSKWDVVAAMLGY